MTLVFDGDDTLWETERLYDDARAAARAVVEGAGIDGARWEARQRVIDVDNVAAMGLSQHRFPTSCAQAYDVQSAATRCSPDPRIRSEIFQVAWAVFSRRAALYPGVSATLNGLRTSWQLVLFTKGDPEIQDRRVKESGLATLFHTVRVVPMKVMATWQVLIDELAIDPRRSWSIGNSVPSDITPALECGLWAAWIDRPVWEYEQSNDVPSSRAFRLSSLDELPNLLQKWDRDHN